MKKSTKRVFTALLALVMLVVAIPMTALVSSAMTAGVYYDNDFSTIGLGAVSGGYSTKSMTVSKTTHDATLGAYAFGTTGGGNSYFLLNCGSGEYKTAPNSGAPAYQTIVVSYTFTQPSASKSFPLSFTLDTNAGGNAKHSTSISAVDTMSTQKIYFFKDAGTFTYDSGETGVSYTIGESVTVTMQMTIYNASETYANGAIALVGYVNGKRVGEGVIQGRDNVGTNPIAICDGSSNCPQYFKLGRYGSNYNGDTYVERFRIYNGAKDVVGVDEEMLVAAPEVPEVQTTTGASIRLGSSASESGIRFTFGVSKAEFDALVESGADVTVGAMILPTDWITTYGLSEVTHEALAAKSLTVIDRTITGFSSESDASTYYFNIAIVQLYEQNFARAFTAVGYLLVDGEYYYSANSDSRSVLEVANNYADSDLWASAGTTVQGIVDGYRDKVVSLTISGGEASQDARVNYTSPYTVTYTDTTLTITGTGASGISSVVINGEVYIGGWTTNSATEICMLYSAQ